MSSEFSRYQTGITKSALHSLLVAAARSYDGREGCIVVPDPAGSLIIASSEGDTQPEARTLPASQLSVQAPVLLDGKEIARLVLVEPAARCRQEDLVPFADAAAQIMALSDAGGDAQAKVDESKVLREIGLRLGEQQELQGLLQSVVKDARLLLNADYASIAIADTTGATRWIAVEGNQTDIPTRVVFEPGKGLAGRVMSARQPVVLDEFRTADNFSADEFPINSAEQAVSALGVPLMRAGKPFGALILGSRSPRKWKSAEIELASVLANSAAVASAQMRSMAEERNQRAFLERVFEDFPGVLVVLGPPPEHRVKFINSRMSALLPEQFQGPHSAVGLPLSALSSASQRNSGNSQETLELLSRVYETGQPISYEQYASTTANTGTTYWNWTIAPIGEKEDVEGRSLILLAHDITDITTARKEAQSAASEARLRADELEAVINQMADGVAICDSEGTPVKLNPAGELLLGRGVASADDLSTSELSAYYKIYSPDGELFDSEQLPATRAARGEVVVGEQLVIHRPDGKDTVISVSAAPLYNIQKAVTGSVAIFRDITHEKLVERLKDEFLSVVSHELRTPLSAITGYSDLMLRGVHGALSDRQARATKAIRANASRLLHLINDLLDASKLDSGAVPVYLEPTDLGSLVAKTITQTHVLALEAGLQVQNNVSPKFWVLGDEHRLQQVIENLLANAIKFTPRDGIVRIDAAYCKQSADDPAIIEEDLRVITDDPARAKSVIVSVRDTGMGLEDEQLERIWDRFYQVDASAKRRSGGTGLGLTIVRGLMQLHDGQVWAESAGHARGSTFSFSVPIAHKGKSSSDEDVTENALPRQETKPSEKGTLVLVAEDDADQREIICEMLELDGFEVVLAADGATARELATRLKPAVIALDVLLPRMDGWEVLNYLKTTPETKDIPVLIISVVDHPEFGKKLGAAEYLLKPIEPATLRETFRRIVGRAQSTKAGK